MSRRTIVLAALVAWLLVFSSSHPALAKAPEGASTKLPPAYGLRHSRRKLHRIRPVRRRRRSARLRSRRGSSARFVRLARYRRRARPIWSPWHVSSLSDPALGDDAAGEDPAIRQAAVEALGNLNGSIVVVDPNTGRILSIVNQRLALASGFIPCSTIKPIIALAALKEGLVTPHTKVRIYGRARLNMVKALAHSNNAYFAKLGEMLGFARVERYAREMDLGQKAGWEIPGESRGVLPASVLSDSLGGVGKMTSFGQGFEVTPLQMAAVLAAIANGGTLYYLQYARTPEEIAAFHPMVHRQLTDLAPYIPELKEGLAAAVLYGTARLAYTPDEQIFGKTGTCSEDGARLGWFDSFSAQGQAKYTVVVMLRGGRRMFGPHAAEIAGQFYRGLAERERAGTQAMAGR